MKKYVIGIDCGTSVIKTALFDLSGDLISICRKKCDCTYSDDGRIEQDAGAILKGVISCLKEIVHQSAVKPNHIAAVAIANQRATLISVDNEGEVLGNAISWQDMRGENEISNFKESIAEDDYYEITGLPINPVFTLAKILWMKKNKPEVYKKVAKFCLVHDFIAKELGAADYYLDISNASLTGLLDISSLTWSQEILDLSGLLETKLPKLVASGTIIGAISKQVSQKTGLSYGTPIVSGGGDQQCAGIGAGCIKKGIMEVTLGTAAVTLVYSDRRIRDPQNRIMCCAHAVPGVWEVEGLQNAAGASLNWISKIVNNEKKFSKSFCSKLIDIPPGSGGLLFYPYLLGAAAPNWNTQAKAMFLGLTHQHNKEYVVRSVMEGVSMEIKQIIDVIASLDIPISEIRLTGGCTKIDVWNQIQADIYGNNVSTLACPEATLIGSAILASVGVGLFKTVSEASNIMVKTKKEYFPIKNNVSIYKDLFRRYCAFYTIFKEKGGFSSLP